MSISVKTINHLITLSRWSFENAKDNVEIQGKIKDYGYDVMRMESLITLNGQMDIKYLEQQKIRAEQDAAFKNYSEQYQEERKQCKHLRLLVRRVIPENEFEKYKRLLGIDERLKETFEGFSEQARKLYTRCQDDKDLLNRLETQFKQTIETFQVRLAALDVLVDLHKKHETAKALSQVATRNRDNLFHEFKKEWANFRDICKIAYEGEDNPQYQELVGIKAYSPGYQKNPTDETEPPVPPIPPVPPVPTIPPTPPALVSTTGTPDTIVTPVTQDLQIKN
ncbi:MAG TPA: hypothetical protein VK469_03780 [Candidatus Kapabacteria bacterium]|nr:hypothetical protein [Candidatus Kapabacteria bacterium]